MGSVELMNAARCLRERLFGLEEGGRGLVVMLGGRPGDRRLVAFNLLGVGIARAGGMR